MQTLLALILAFLEGIGLILSPCVWPIIPLILAGSLVGSKKRPWFILLGFIVSFSLFVLFSRKLITYLNIDSNTVRHIAYGFLLIFSFILIVPFLQTSWSKLTRSFSRLSRYFTHANAASGFILGASIAIIWTPCAGPILAAIIVQTILQKTTFMSFLLLLAFSMGVILPIILISLYGQTIKQHSFFKEKSFLFRPLLGFILLISTLYLLYLENQTLAPIANKSTIRVYKNLKSGLLMPYKAPPIEGIAHWINSAPINLETLRGKVVLLDFWTYSCINCLRTLPYLKDWYAKYHQYGFEIIGIHSPEFDFEKNYNNVLQAVSRFGLRYPIALDNAFKTWQNYDNHYWPAHYLIDKEGYVVYTHFGEGKVDVTENNIRFLLKLNEDLKKTANPLTPPISSLQTPETYLGYGRASLLLAPRLYQNREADYANETQLESNAWTLKGRWLALSDKIIAKSSGAMLKLHFNAKNIYMVMATTTDKPQAVDIYINDIWQSTLIVDKARLYPLAKFTKFTSGIITIVAKNTGLALYALTFGS